MSKLYQRYYEMTRTTGDENDRTDLDNRIRHVLCSFCKQVEADYTASSTSRGIKTSGNLIKLAVELFLNGRNVVFSSMLSLSLSLSTLYAVDVFVSMILEHINQPDLHSVS